jgi:predicted alpha/beta hydrolase family esterase
MKKIFIIPGFKQKPTDKYFIWLKKFLHSKNFDVAIVPINWNYKTMSDYTEEFEKFYNKHKSEENYILGFSYGAVITFFAAEKLKPKKIYLCP